MSRTVAKISRREKWKRYIEKNRKGNWYFLKKDAKEIVFRIIRFFMLFGMCFLILQPILNKISVSFMAEKDLYNPMVIAIPETSQQPIMNLHRSLWITGGHLEIRYLYPLRLRCFRLLFVQWLDMDLQDLNSRLRSSGFCV